MSIAPNPVEPPSPANRYRLPERVHATADLFNLVFSSIGARLDAAEGKSADYDAAIDRIVGQALQTVSAALTVEIAAGRAEFAGVRAAFEELQTDGFSAARIAATLAGQGGIRDVQAALSFLQTTMAGGLNSLSSSLASEVGKRDRTPYLFSSGPVTLTAENRGGWFDLNGNFTQTFPTAEEVGDGWVGIFRNVGTGIQTLAGLTSLDQTHLHPNDVRMVVIGTARRSIPLFEDAVVNVNSNLNPIWYRTYRLRGAVARTLTLPANPLPGATIRLIDGETTANHVVARNGRTIMGLAENLILDRRGYDLTLWWNDTTWRLF